MSAKGRLLARLAKRVSALGGEMIAGADLEDVRRALPVIESEARAEVLDQLRANLAQLPRLRLRDPGVPLSSGETQFIFSVGDPDVVDVGAVFRLLEEAKHRIQLD